MFGSALAGCFGDMENTSGKDDVDEDTEYEAIDFQDLHLRIDDLDHVALEGYLQYDGLVEWFDDGEDKWLRTYQLYEDDPDKYSEPRDELTSIAVLEYDDDQPIVDTLPENEIVDRTVFRTEVYGKIDQQSPREQTQNTVGNYSEDDVQFVINTHGIRPYNATDEG